MQRPRTAPHEHVWDTEDDAFVTFVPDAAYDWPWVIHECCEPRCDAIQVSDGGNRSALRCLP